MPYDDHLEPLVQQVLGLRGSLLAALHQINPTGSHGVLLRYYCETLHHPEAKHLHARTIALARHLAAGNSDVPATFCD